MGDRDLLLGGVVDAVNHERTVDDLRFDPDELTTHGVIVGMTGSGKTGLAIDLLEESLLQGIPTLVLDPKGDMTNLLLGFPGLSADEFAPWVPPGTDAAATAEMWRTGLEGWGITGDRIAALHAKADLNVYTPGSSAATPLNIIGSMKAPVGDDDESRSDEADGLVSGLLGLMGIDADPLSSREHILLVNLVERAWNEGQDLDLGTLVQQVQDPPMRKLGVIELETFFPKSDRTKLAMQINGLLASPSFAAWAEGAPLDIGALLGTTDRPNAAIVYLAHLSEQERQFVVTLILSKVVTWMRSQPGSPQLRALVYMDEVYGYVPPTAAPPAKKPILTILKQARAYGVGMVLATQNPVDLDYKAISNAGTWMIGRLQTERDKARLLEGMTSAGGEVDVAQIDATISGLDKREFVLHQTGTELPSVFTTRWAMSYLAGPLTKGQLGSLPGVEPAGDAPTTAPEPTEALSAATPAAPPVPVEAEVGEDETTVMPEVTEGRSARFVVPATPWLGEVGGSADGNRLQPAVIARLQLFFDETKGDLRHTEEWEAVIPLSGETFDPTALVEVDFDDRDLGSEPPAGRVFVLPEAKLNTKNWWTTAEKALKDHLYARETLDLFQNPELKLASRPGESAEEFAARCQAAADDAMDAEASKLRDKLTSKAERLRDQIEAAQARIEELDDAKENKKRHELLSGAGDLLGSILGGKKSASSIVGKLKGASSRRSTTDAAQSRLETAKVKADAKVEELEAVEADLEDQLLELDDEWSTKAEAIEPLAVGLERNDITVGELGLVWIPT
ncbi:MAG TPA: DUF87 domain-containing protein [Acidimicrobiales bacterium]|nr:DUF87 domain-containing protein [Acidimicrobiales bacterium]